MKTKLTDWNFLNQVILLQISCLQLLKKDLSLSKEAARTISKSV